MCGVTSELSSVRDELKAMQLSVAQIIASQRGTSDAQSTELAAVELECISVQAGLSHLNAAVYQPP